MFLLQLSRASPTIKQITKREPTCTEVVIPITISANNLYMAPDTSMPEGLDLVTNLLSSIVGLVFDELIQGTFDISGRYCEPQVVIPLRSTTLELLLHGATYNRNYVSF